MIHLVGMAMEEHLRARVPLPSSIVVSFDAPDKAWSARVNGPTVNCYLWDIGRNRQRQHAGVAEYQGANGTERRRPDPVIEFHYLLTAWASEVRDEHQLLGSMLMAFLAHGTIEREDLPAPLDRGAGKLTFVVDEIEDRRMSEISSALDGQLKSGLRVSAFLAVDAGGYLAVGPPVSGVDLQTTDTESGASSSREWAGSAAADMG